MALNTGAVNWIEAHAHELEEVSDTMWELAEVGLQEMRSAELLTEYLRNRGFHVESGMAGMPSAFTASWGSGSPVIGFLGELDALPGLSQKPSPRREPVHTGAPGHGCGHNLLATSALGAACAVQEVMKQQNISGTVRYYGCPAEETLIGKVAMVKEGLFDDVDAVLDWHPNVFNDVRLHWSNAVNSVKFAFTGRTSHAASDPQNGRSALDAVELMNVGANYLREHIPEKARIHYVITDGGGEPNVVPANAEVWYYVRAPERQTVEEIHARLRNIAAGAALMTETSFEERFLAGCYSLLPNLPLTRMIHQVMEEIGGPQWTSEEKEFARVVAESFGPDQRESVIKARKAPAEVHQQLLHEGVMPFTEEETFGAGSTDVGDVSWVVPTGRFTAATAVIGQPGHSWQFAACSGMSIGHKGMKFAAKVLAEGGLRILSDSKLLEEAKEDWRKRTAGNEYKTPLPDGYVPPLDQLPRH